MEPHASIAVWEGDKVTLYETSQAVVADRAISAQVLGLSPDNVQIISPFVGGGFGCKGSFWWHSILAAIAAPQGRQAREAGSGAAADVYVEQGIARARSKKMALSAGRDGKITAISHAALSQTSIIDEFTEPCGLTTRMLYGLPERGGVAHAHAPEPAVRQPLCALPANHPARSRWNRRWTNWRMR